MIVYTAAWLVDLEGALPDHAARRCVDDVCLSGTAHPKSPCGNLLAGRCKRDDWLVKVLADFPHAARV